MKSVGLMTKHVNGSQRVAAPYVVMHLSDTPGFFIHKLETQVRILNNRVYLATFEKLIITKISF